MLSILLSLTLKKQEIYYDFAVLEKLIEHKSLAIDAIGTGKKSC